MNIVHARAALEATEKDVIKMMNDGAQFRLGKYRFKSIDGVRFILLDNKGPAGKFWGKRFGVYIARRGTSTVKISSIDLYQMDEYDYSSADLMKSTSINEIIKAVEEQMQQAEREEDDNNRHVNGSTSRALQAIVRTGVKVVSRASLEHTSNKLLNLSFLGGDDVQIGPYAFEPVELDDGDGNLYSVHKMPGLDLSLALDYADAHPPYSTDNTRVAILITTADFPNNYGRPRVFKSFAHVINEQQVSPIIKQAIQEAHKIKAENDNILKVRSVKINGFTYNRATSRSRYLHQFKFDDETSFTFDMLGQDVSYKVPDGPGESFEDCTTFKQAVKYASYALPKRMLR